MAFNGVQTADRLAEPSYGLFSVAEVVNHGARDEHWIGGYYVETNACNAITEIQPLCTNDDPSADTIVGGAGTGDPFFHVAPFAIIERFKCENSIGYNAVDRRATVVDQLKRNTEFAVEAELWHGFNSDGDADMIPAERWLSNTGAGSGLNNVTVSAGGSKAIIALAAVEQAFAESHPGIQATIHVTPLIATILNNDLEEKDGVLYTPAGSKLTISRGGNGLAGPIGGGSDATTHWIYATGPVHVDLGSEELITVSSGEIVNPETNAVEYVAERPAAVYFDGCGWFAALADATL